MNKFIYAFIALIALVAGYVALNLDTSGEMTAASSSTTTATFLCDAAMDISASFVSTTIAQKVSNSAPVTKVGQVVLTLNGDQHISLPQVVSADGGRYASSDGATEFWNKGRAATFTRASDSKSLTCIEVATDPGGLPEMYRNVQSGFSVRYPTGAIVDESYTYRANGPDTAIRGIKFTIPMIVASGTNLSSDSYISIESVEATSTCDAQRFLSPGVTMQNVTDAGTDYSVATSSDAGAGNRYEETVYALPGTIPCTGVRYFIHSMAIENYPKGAVQAFDRTALNTQFDAMRRTLLLAR